MDNEVNPTCHALQRRGQGNGKRSGEQTDEHTDVLQGVNPKRDGQEKGYAQPEVTAGTNPLPVRGVLLVLPPEKAENDFANAEHHGEDEQRQDGQPDINWGLKQGLLRHIQHRIRIQHAFSDTISIHVHQACICGLSPKSTPSLPRRLKKRSAVERLGRAPTWYFSREPS